MEAILVMEGFLDSPENGYSAEAVSMGVTRKSDDTPDDKSSTSSDGPTDLKERLEFREWLRQVLCSTTFQMTVVALVLLESALVIGELLLDLSSHGTHNIASFVLHILSIALLAVFTLEIALKLYAYQLDFFKHKAEVFDAIVVIVALCLDAAFLRADDARTGTGLIIILRLWRLVRIQNAMVMQVRHVADKKLVEERQRRQAAEEELQRMNDFLVSLKEKLREHNIEFEEDDQPPRW